MPRPSSASALGMSSCRHVTPLVSTTERVFSTSSPSRCTSALVAVDAKPHDFAPDQDFRAEALRLLERAAAQIVSGHAAGKSEIVLDAGRGPGLPSGCLALDQHRAQPLRRAVHRGGEPGGTAADDRHVVERLARLGLQSDLLGQRAQRRRDHALTVGKDHHRVAVTVTRRGYVLVQLRARRIDPAEDDAVSHQEVAQAMAGDVVAMSDDGHARRRRFRRELAQVREASRHGARELRREVLACREQLGEIGVVEPGDARWLERAQARERGRAEQQRQLAEVLALPVGVDAPVGAMHDLAHLQRSIDEHEKGRLLAFVDQPLAGAQVHVGHASGERLRLAVGKRCEQGNRMQLGRRDHGRYECG